LKTLSARNLAPSYARFSELGRVGAAGLVLGRLLHRMVHTLELEDVEGATGVG
jgi:hypothetical protein